MCSHPDRPAHEPDGAPRAVAHIRTPYTDSFGIPRQGGLAPDVPGTVVFLPEYRDPAYVRGLEQATHIWLIWRFSQSKGGAPSATVRPPMLGGNRRIGVFASRSPFRPARIGLSCVRLTRVERTDDLGAVLHVSGADLMDGTEIIDIKPYVPYADCVPDARYPIAQDGGGRTLCVVFPPELLARVPEPLRQGLLQVLAQDPRPRYQQQPDRVYGFGFGGQDIRFSVADGVVTVCDVADPME